VANVHAAYLENRPGPVFRSYRFDGAAWVMTNGAGDRVGNTLFAGSDWRLRNYWRYILNVGYTFRNLSDRLTRGGPLALYPADRRLYTELQTDERRPLGAAGGLFLKDAGEGGRERMAWARLTLRGSPRWNLSVGPQLTRLRQGAQYVAAVDDALAAETFGRRYVFATLDQTTLGLETRLNWTFTPKLTLQLFAQPFVTAAHFDGYKELAAPRGFAFAVYGRDRGTIAEVAQGWEIDPDGAGPAAAFTVGERFGQRDFVLRSLRGNAVLRWEWRPGSTMYLAWQQSRENNDVGPGDFRLGRDRAALFGAAPDNVFVFKLTYWLNP
jgi:hypothetical protein